MKNFILSILSVSFLISCSSGIGGDESIEPNNSIELQWTKIFVGDEGGGMGYSVQQTTDGGYIITGRSKLMDNNTSDVYSVKTDENGIKQWSNSYIGEKGFSIQQTTDGGYIITGVGFPNDFSDIYLIKTYNNGDQQWIKRYGGGYGSDEGYSVQQTTDGGYIITGWTSSFGNGNTDVYIIKTDSHGDSLWTKTYGGTGHDHGRSIQQTTDGGYIITGWTSSFGDGNTDVYIIKTDSHGDSLWTKRYGGAGHDHGRSIQQTSDGGYIITGETNSFGNGQYDVYLIKTDENGNEQWSQTFGGGSIDKGYSVQQTTDGGYVITGNTKSFGNGEYDVYLIKTDENGNEQWSQTIGVEGNGDYGYSVQQTNDGGYIITGGSHLLGVPSNLYLIKTDRNGDISP